MDLTLQLRTMDRVLSHLVADPPNEVFDAIVEAVMGHAARQEMDEAVRLLETAMEANPFWLRGYLLLGTIHQHQENLDKASAVTENGLAACIKSLRLFASQEWLDTVERINGPAAHERTSRSADRFSRYEYIFRHRLALLQIGSGCFDDAIKQWAEIEDEHCA